MAIEKFVVHTLLALSFLSFDADLILALEEIERIENSDAKHSAQVKEACVREMTKYVRKTNLCGMPDTEMVPSGLTPSTCANRCGVAKTYGSFLTCACDDKCVIHQDCCSDMQTHCPRVLARAKQAARQLPDVNMTCEGQILLVTKASKDSSLLFSTTWSPKSTQDHVTRSRKGGVIPEFSTQRFPTTEFSFSVKQRVKLQDIFHHITDLKIADTELGVIFDDYYTFWSWGRPAHNIAFVPHVSTLACLKSSLDPLTKRNILRILPACLVTATQPVPTVFHRSCKWESKVSCRCETDFVITGYLNDVCFNQNQLQVQHLSHEPLPGLDMHDQCQLNYLPFHHKLPSQITTVTDSVVNIAFTGAIGNLQQAVPLTLNPVVVCDKLSSPHLVTDDILTTEIHDELADGVDNKQVSWNNQQFFWNNLPVEFVVDLTGTLEKRIRCPGFNNPLLDCHLEECSEGTFLVTKPLSPWSFNGMRCMLPGFAVAKSVGTHMDVSVCNCFRIASVETSLGVWSARVKISTSNECIIHLNQISEANKYPQDIFNFSESLSKPPTTLFLGNLSFQSVMERMSEQMDKTRETCKDEKEEDIDVCFYSWTLDELEGKELAVCIRLSSSLFRNERNTGKLVVNGLWYLHCSGYLGLFLFYFYKF